MPRKDLTARSEYNRDYYHNFTPAQRAAAVVRTKEWRLANPERARLIHQRNHLSRNFGITPEQVDEMSKAQGDRCAICGRHIEEIRRVDSRGRVYDRLYVDHDPESNQIRGLLCKDCNTALGLLQEEPGIIAVALEYVLCG